MAAQHHTLHDSHDNHGNDQSKEHNALEEDHKLAQRIIAKEPAACRALYDTYAPRLLRRLYRLTSNHEDAEDGLQHVMVEALRSMEQYRGDGPLGAWLNRIATHKAMDILRKRQRWRGFVERFKPTHDVAMEVEPLPEELFLRKETRQWIWQMVERLTPHKRMAIMLCDLEGKTIEDAAQELGLPVGTMISRLYSGRKELRRLCENERQRLGTLPGEQLHDET